jgi:uncharacterized repeat protein (TIGR01451 family)
MADDHDVPVALTPIPTTFEPSDVRGNPWICIDRGYLYGFTVAQNIPNSQDNNQVTTPIVKNGKNVLGKDTPADESHFVTLTSSDGVNFSWETNFDVGAVIVKGSDAFNQYTYAAPGAGGVQGDLGPLTTPEKNGEFPKINQVTLCWGPVTPPPPLASLTVTKKVDGMQPGEITPPFAFRITEDGTPFDFELVGDQTSDVYGIAAGVPTTLQEVLDAMPPGYAFRVLECTAIDPSVPANGVPVETEIVIDGATATINAAYRADVHCTFTNEKLPTIQVVKQVVGDGAPAQSFAFLVNANGFNLLAGGSSDIYTVPVGASSVSETVGSLPSTFALTAAACTVGQTGDANLGTGTVNVDLKAGENTVCTFTNTYTAPPGETTGTPPPAVVNQVRNPRLAIVKTGPARARPLDRITYSIRVRNPGRAVARNVVITDWLPSGMTFVKASRKATVKGRTIIIPMGNLQPGQSRAVKITVRASVNVTGRKINLAVARADNVRAVRDTAPTVFTPLVRRVIPEVTG